MSKKLIVGSTVVASLAVALAPLATFADTKERTPDSDVHTDRFLVNIEPACSFGKEAVGTEGQDGYVAPIVSVEHNEHTANTGTALGTAEWTSNVEAADDESEKDSNTDNVVNRGRTLDTNGGTAYEQTDRAAYTIYAGTEKAGFATTTLRVVCNQANGYHVTVKMNDLVHATDSNTKISPNADYNAGTTGYAIDKIEAKAGAVGKVETEFASKTAKTAETPFATADKEAATAGDAYDITYGIGIAPSQKSGTYKGNVVYTLYQLVDAA